MDEAQDVPVELVEHGDDPPPEKLKPASFPQEDVDRSLRAIAARMATGSRILYARSSKQN